MDKQQRPNIDRLDPSRVSSVESLPGLGCIVQEDECILSSKWKVWASDGINGGRLITKDPGLLGTVVDISELQLEFQVSIICHQDIFYGSLKVETIAVMA